MKATSSRDDFKERLFGESKLCADFVNAFSMEYFKQKCAYDSGTFSQQGDCFSDFEVGQDSKLDGMSLAPMDLVKGSQGLGVERDYPGLASDNRGFVPVSDNWEFKPVSDNRVFVPCGATAECKMVSIGCWIRMAEGGACTMNVTVGAYTGACTCGGAMHTTMKPHIKSQNSICDRTTINRSGLPIVKSHSQCNLRSQVPCMDIDNAYGSGHLASSGILLQEPCSTELNSNGAIIHNPCIGSRIPHLESRNQLETLSSHLDANNKPTQSLSHPPQSKTQSLEPYSRSSKPCYAKSMPENLTESTVPLTSTSQRSRSPLRSKSTSSMHKSGLVTGNNAQPHSGLKTSLSHNMQMRSNMQMSSRRTRMYSWKSLSFPAFFNPASFLSTFSTVILILSVITHNALLVSAQDDPEPAWITQPSDTKITESGTQRIYCRIRNRGARQIAWIQYNEGEVKNLFIDDGRWAAPDHYDIEKKVDGYDLIIRNAQRDDDSDVQCQLQQSDLNKRVKVTILGEYSKFPIKMWIGQMLGSLKLGSSLEILCSCNIQC